MCIRDRNVSAISQQQLSEWSEEAGIEWMGPSDVMEKVYACLLYTSDAADERSSVDLGGRRIIKKKKRDTSDGRGFCSTTGVTNQPDSRQRDKQQP